MKMRQKSLKHFLFLLVLTFLAVALLACKETGGSTTESSTAQTDAASQLSFRITWTDYSGRGQAIQKIVDSYNAISADDKDVVMIGGDENQTTIEQMLASSPETVFVLPYRYVQYFGYRGELMDLTDSFTEEKSLFY